MVWFGLLNATYISVISWQLYWCRKPDYPEKIIDLSKVNANVASSTSILSGVRTHNYHTITANLWCHGVLWRVCVCVISILFQWKKSLTILKGKSEAVNWKMTYETMTERKEKRNGSQNTAKKTKDWATTISLQTGWDQVNQMGKQFLLH
jgi:hypothetical protein